MSVSKLSHPQQYEPVLRAIISSLNQGMTKTMGFPSTNYSHLLNAALKDMAAAQLSLRQWAEALEIQLHDSMPT